jgi:hypothetical protein
MEKQQKWPGALVRKTFLDYFEKRGHTIGMLKLSDTHTTALMGFLFSFWHDSVYL